MRWTRYFRRGQWERERAAEIESYLDIETAENIERGMTPQEARDAALRKFGNTQLVREEIRAMNTIRPLETMLRDLRYAARALRRSPAFFLTAVLTLALGIGANTAIFSIVDCLLLRPLPYPQPDRLAQVIVQFVGGGGGMNTGVNGSVWELVRDGLPGAGKAVYSGTVTGVNLAFPGQNRAEFTHQQRVGAGYFATLGVPPQVGREFNAEEDRDGGPKVAILSHTLWRRLFALDPQVAGRTIQLRGEPYTVVGVMPDGFRAEAEVDVWTPLRPSTTGEGRGSNYHVVARLPAATSWQAAQAQLDAAWAARPRTRRANEPDEYRLLAVPLQASYTADIRTPLLILWSAVGVVLLIACVNIASLLLARAGTRARELATRLALGCGRAGIVRQLLTESLIISIAGGLLGTVLGAAALRGLTRLAGDLFPIWQRVEVDPRVLAATAALSLLTSLLFGLAPALHFSRLDINGTLIQSGGRGHAGRANHWPQRLLVVSEVALGVILLVSSGLLLRSFAHLRGLDPGFDPNHVLSATFSLQDTRYQDPARVSALFRDGLARIRQSPGVESAAVTLSLPYQRALNVGFHRLDGPAAREQRNEITNLTYVSPGFFETLRVPLRRGRLFSDADTASSAPSVIVNNAFAATYFREQEAVGSHIQLGKQQFQVVGVVGDVQSGAGWGNFGPYGQVPYLYVPAAQLSPDLVIMAHTWFSPSWVVRGSGGRNALMSGIQQAIGTIDPLLPISAFQEMDEVRAGRLDLPRFMMALLTALAGLALLLSGIGLYGLISGAVTERTRELGIRMALGATTGQTVRSVVLPGFWLTLTGVSIGLLGALAVTRVLRSMLWGVTTSDPLTLAGVAAGLLLVAVLASLAPAARILRLDPATTLRHE
ncbi:ABC transporter permease [uncultured Paludibaculum sp.]|uniref:ABC transporter permease n=1 Tax=uncultured Paludibaculum sp. TaxID=1765020 RepID=UPI002AAC43C8|nr:ABC transporter permease [uncultured Paludibaculum sp.]